MGQDPEVNRTEHRTAGLRRFSRQPVSDEISFLRKALAAEPAGEDEPDYRFTLANERTFLAWIRTALGLLAASVVIGELFTAPGANGRHLAVLAVLCTATAVLISVSAFTRWRHVQEAMRHSAPLPSPTLMMRLVVIVMCVSAVVCTAIVLG